MSDSHRYISCAIRSDALTAPLLGLRSGTQLARVCTARLTAPESVGRRCVQLRESGADFALGPRMVHGALAFWMQTTGACQVGTSSAGGQRCLRSCRRAVACPCCCTSCCMALTLTRQGNSVRLPSAILALLVLARCLPLVSEAKGTGRDCQCRSTPAWDKPPMEVGQCPPLAVANVTHLATQSAIP